MFDHNHENMDCSSQSLKPKDYRKKEIRLWKGFRIIYFSIIILSIFFKLLTNIAPTINVGSSGFRFNVFTFYHVALYSFLIIQYCI